MGRETSEWYNTQILVGFTEQRGHAWHYKADQQGAEPNHYPHAIPIADVERRLFSWKADKLPVFINRNGTFQEIPNRKAITRDDLGITFGVFTDSYGVHQYGDWLLKNLGNIIDDDLAIGSAGLLKDGGIAWVSLEMPENIKVVDGFELRPHLMATTSHNGMIPTIYKQVATVVVCDNTWDAAMGENAPNYKVRHTKQSQMQIQNARDALKIVHTMSEKMTANIEKLLAVKVSDSDFDKIVKYLNPQPQAENKIALTKWEHKTTSLRNLYFYDHRASQWKGTAIGVIQAFNTYNHHVAGTDKKRVERNMMNVLNGTFADADKELMELLVG